ncbi:MAG TPA: CARDB domain-containing protein [Verrucomicrobiota bacterium]|nr:CARDB domain-containing protein [Verrucomicrobiota bacterium]
MGDVSVTEPTAGADGLSYAASTPDLVPEGVALLEDDTGLPGDPIETGAEADPASAPRRSAGLAGGGEAPQVAGFEVLGFQDWAGVTWSTDELSTALLRWGLNSGAYTEESLDGVLSLDHRVRIEGLAPGTTFYGTLTVTDAGGHAATGPEFVFTTTSRRQTALVCGDVTALTDREQAVLAQLEAQPILEVTRVAAAGATHEDLRQYEWVVLTDYARGPPAADTQALVDDWTGVVMFADSGKALGGAWTSNTTSTSRRLVVQTDDPLVSDYGVGTQFEAQASGRIYGVHDLTGWEVVGVTYASYGTVLRRGGNWLFTYDPALLSNEGRVVVANLVRGMAGVTAPSSSIPAGHVALLLQDYDDPSQMTNRETALASELAARGLEVMVVPQSQRHLTDYTDAAFVVMAHKIGVPLVGFFERLMTGGTHGVLMADAAAALDVGVSGGTGDYWRLVVSDSSGFLDAYEIGSAFRVQSEGTAHHVDGIAGWTPIGYSRYGQDKTILIRDHGVVFTYDPSQLVGEGRVVFTQLVRSITGNESFPAMVPAGDVALLVADYEETPVLTSQEIGLRDRLIDMGYGVTVVPASGRFTTDYRQAALVAMTHTMGALLGGFFDRLMSGGTPVLLTANAVGALNVGVGGGTGDYWRLVVSDSSGFLDAYDVGSTFRMQSEGTAHHVDGIAGWTPIGYSRYGQDKTILIRDHGVVFTYDPSQLIGEGRVVFAGLVRALTGNESLTATVPEGEAALLISDYEATAVLTPQEAALRDRLVGLGYQVTLVPGSERFTTDYSRAAFVALAQSPGFALGGFLNGLADEGIGVALLYNAGEALGSNWYASGFLQLAVLSGEGFLSEYDVGTTLVMQTAGSSWRTTAVSLSGWTLLGATSTTSSSRTAFARDRGGLLAYDPVHLSPEGEVVFAKLIEHVSGKPVVRRVIPDGNAALVIKEYATAQILTPQEQALRDRLVAAGYTVTVVPYGLRALTDYRKAALVGFAEYGGFPTKVFLDRQIADQVRVLLINEAARLLGGTWSEGSVANSRQLVVTNSTAFLDRHPLNTKLIIQSAGTSWYAQNAATVPGWTVLGYSQNTYNPSVFIREAGGGAGVVLPYDLRYYTSEGDQVFDDALAWLDKEVGADAGADRTVSRTLPVTFDASGSWAANPIAAYEWDLDGDGEYDDAAGVTATRSWDTVGSYTVGLRVRDTAGVTATDSVTVLVKSNVDLVIDAVERAPWVYQEGDTVTFTITLRNAGLDTLADDFYVNYRIDGVHLASVAVRDAIPAGGTVQLTRTWSGQVGKASFEAIADHQGKVFETDETNNSRRHVLAQLDRADLVITALTWTPESFVEGETVVLNATVANMGTGGTSVVFAVSFTVDGYYLGRQLLAGLDAGASASVQRTWTAAAGTHTVRARADYYGVVTELDETNNTRSVVLPLVADLTPPQITRFTPGDQAVIGPSAPLAVSATDNVAVAAYRLEASRDGVGWTLIAEGAAGTAVWDTTGLAEGTWHLRATVSDAAGNQTAAIHQVVLDSTPPPAPVALTAASAELVVRLNWQASTAGDVIGYAVYRSTTAGTGHTLLADSVELATYADTSGVPGQPHYYVVRAVDRAGNRSPASAEVSGTPEADVTPPSLATFVPVDGTRIRELQRLSASAADNGGIVAFTFERSTDGLTWVLMQTGPKNNIDWDTRTVADGTWQVRVTVRDAAGNISSAVRSFVVDNTAPTPPVLTATGIQGAIRLQWTPSPESDVKSYTVLRSDTPGGPYHAIVVSGQGNSREDRGGVAGVTWYYVVTARDDLGNTSAYSNQAAAAALVDTTPPANLTLSVEAGTVLHRQIAIIGRATDNVGMLDYRLDYSMDGAVWQAIGTAADGKFVWDTLAVEDGTYTLRLTARDQAGNTASLTRSCEVINSLLPAPENLRSQIGEWSATLGWSPVQDDRFEGYRLYRRVDAGEFVLRAETASTVFVEHLLDPASAYAYQVSAVDRWGVEGARSAILEVQTRQQTSSPTSVTLGPPSGTRFSTTLVLTASGRDQVGIVAFRFQYSRDGVQWFDIGTDATPEGSRQAGWHGGVTWNSVGLDPGTLQVRVQAVNYGNVSATGSADYVCDVNGPEAPPELDVLNPRSGGQLDLSWSQPADTDVAGYRVYRAAVAGGPYTALSDLVTGLGYADITVANGTAYHYVVKAVDLAGNESPYSVEASAIATAEADLKVAAVRADPAAPPGQRICQLIARIENAAPAAATGWVSFYRHAGELRELLGQIQLAEPIPGGGGVDVSLAYTPLDLGWQTFLVEVTDVAPVDVAPANNQLAGQIRINESPTAPVMPAVELAWGQTLTVNGGSAWDADGVVRAWHWDFGDGAVADGALAAHAYRDLGVFTVTLTVTDNDGATGQSTFTVTVLESRPDLVLRDLAWTPEEPDEGQMVTITATIANEGVGATVMGFFATYYIDGQYAGYERMDVRLAPGETTEASFAWLGLPGVHTVEVRADDIQNNIAEIREDNNAAFAPMTTRQVFFPDLTVAGLTVTPTAADISSQESIRLAARVSNLGDAAAEGVWVALFLDGAFSARKQVAQLTPGAEATVTFDISPVSSGATAVVMADGPASGIVEANEANNTATIDLPAYALRHPDLTISSLDWTPKETEVANGAGLTLTAIVANTGTADVIRPFTVSFYVNGEFVGSREGSQLAVGGETTFTVRWPVKPGTHELRAVVDETGEVVEVSEANNQQTVLTEALDVFYADLTIGEVRWLPLPTEITYGDTLTLMVDVTNNSLVSTYGPFWVSLFLDGRLVDSLEVPVLNGLTTTAVPLGYEVHAVGPHDIAVRVDSRGAILEASESNNVYALTTSIADSFVFDFDVDGQDPTLEGLPPMYVSRETMHLSAAIAMASGLDLSGDDADGFVTVRIGGVPVIDHQPMSYNPRTRDFEYTVPLPGYVEAHGTGTYMVEVTATDGLIERTVAFPVIVIEEVIFTLETDRPIYQRGTPVQFSGDVLTLSGKPLANQTVELLVAKGEFDDMNASHLFMAAMLNEMMKGLYGVETGVRVETFSVMTNDDGHFTATWMPRWNDGGYFTANTLLLSSRVIGTIGKCQFEILGLAADPAELTVAVGKNTVYQRDITFSNLGDNVLTGFDVELLDLSHSGKVKLTMDTSKVTSNLHPGGRVTVSLRFEIAEDAPDTAGCLVTARTAEGAMVTSMLNLQLRPAVPVLRFEPETLAIALHPGETRTTQVKVTNVGLGTMRGMALVDPAILPWVDVAGLSAIELAPGAEAVFEVAIRPPEDCALGVYADRVGIRNGTSAYLPIQVEVTSANRGSVAIVVFNDAGETVPGADIRLTAREPHVVLAYTGESYKYFPQHFLTTDAEGRATLTDAEVGEYDFVILAPAHERFSGVLRVQPFREAAILDFTLTLVPVLYEWKVTPTTITDEYDIVLNLTFAARIPTPTVVFVPPWVAVPQQVGAAYTDWFVLINPSAVELHDVRVTVKNAPGITVVGDGYLGTLAPQSTVIVEYRVAPGNYSYLSEPDPPGMLEVFNVAGSYVAFNSATLLAYEAQLGHGTGVNLDLVNPSERKVTLWFQEEYSEVALPAAEGEGGDGPELPPPAELGGGEQDEGVTEVVSLRIPQKAALEREAFDCTLELTNGYARKSMDNLVITLRVEDAQGRDVTSQFYTVGPEVTGLSDVDGGDSLAPLSEVAAYWQLIPGEGLGGTTLDGQKYYVRAFWTYFVNGRLVQTQTEAAEITIHPQPKLLLHYFIAKEVRAYQPFKLGLVVENIGDGIARNLRIESGQPEIVENESGLLIDFNIVAVSFGGSQGETFKLVLGDVQPHSTVSGYWLLNCNLDGSFQNFTAEMTHRLYKGIELNPLIAAIDTQLIVMDSVVLDPAKPDETYSLIDQDADGFPDYFINLATGLHLPLTVPSSVTVTRPATVENKTLALSVPKTPGYIVVITPDQHPDWNVTRVERTVPGEDPFVLGIENCWKQNGNLYFIDEGGGDYLVDYRSGFAVQSVEFTPAAVYAVSPEDSPIFFQTGIKPDLDDVVYLRARVFNQGIMFESARLDFFDVNAAGEETLIASTLVEAHPFWYSGVPGKRFGFLFGPVVTWTPTTSGARTLIARLATDSAQPQAQVAVTVNATPVAAAGHDFTGTVGVPILFDGSGSSDADGFIRNYAWDFGEADAYSYQDPEGIWYWIQEATLWGSGQTATYTYTKAGTYHVTLHVTDDNGDEGTDTLLVTIRETRPDLIIESLTLDPAQPQEGQTVAVTALLANRGVLAATAPFYVSLYVDDQYHATVKVTETLAAGATRAIPFSWPVVLGNHRLTAIADDIEDRIVESAEDNNAKSVLVYPEQVNFPDLVIDQLSWSEGTAAVTLGWGQPTTLNALIANRGAAAAGGFSVSFYVDGEFLSRAIVPGLLAQAGSNTIEVAAPYVPTAGDHLVSVLVDGPIRHVLETHENNNSARLQLPTVRIAYADLQVAAIGINPESGRVADTATLEVRAQVTNTGGTSVFTPVEVAIYIDGAFRGRRVIESLAAGGSEWVSIDWTATAGDHDLRATVDPENVIVEANESNNTTDRPAVPVTILYPDLLISDLRWVPGAPQYADSVQFRITVANRGEAPTQGPFVTTLTIGNQTPIRITHSDRLPPGAAAVLSASWQAFADTTEPIAVTAAADVASLVESDETNNTATATLVLRHGLAVAASSQYAGYLVGSDAVLRAVVSRSDALDTPLGSAGGLAVAYQLRNDAGQVVASGPMTYNSVAQLWLATVPAPQLSAGYYTAVVTAVGALGTFTDTAEFAVVEDFIITLATNREEYGAQENILFKGQAQTTQGVLIRGLPVTIQISGAVEATLTGVLQGNGQYNVIWSSGGQGGLYQATASLEVGGVTRTATTTFEVQGLAITPYPAVLQIPQGGQAQLEFNLRNAGTDRQTLINVSVAALPDLPGLSAGVGVQSSFDLTHQGDSRTVTLTVGTGLETPTGLLTFQLVVDSAESAPIRVPVKVTVIEAAPAYTIWSLDNPADPLSIEMAMYAGTSLSRALRVTNSGSATMTGLTLSSPHLPWLGVGTGNLPAALAPGESGSLTVYFQPPRTLAKGSYTDSLVLSSNAGQLTVHIAAEITTAATGALSLAVLNAHAQPLSDVRVTLRFQQSLGVLMELLEDADAAGVPGTSILAATDGQGRVAFAELPVGTYYLALESEYYAPTTSTIDVKPTWDTPQSLTFIMPDRPWRFEWDYAAARPWTAEEIDSGWSLLADATANPACVASYNPAYTEAAIQMDQPGQAIVLNAAALTGTIPLSLLVRNASTGLSLQNVTARVEGFPTGAVLLGGAGSPQAWFGDMGPRETLTLAFSVAGTAFEAGAAPQVIRGALVIEGEVVDASGAVQRVSNRHYLQVVVPPNAPAGWSEVPGLRDALSRQIRMRGALSGDEILVDVLFYEYLRSQIHHSPSPLPELPDVQESSWVTVDVGQTSGVEGEPITVTVEVHNRSETDSLENLEVELVLLTAPAEDTDGGTGTGTAFFGQSGQLIPIMTAEGTEAVIARGRIPVTTYFDVEKEIVPPSEVLPGETVVATFKLTPKKGTSRIAEGQFYLSVSVRYTIAGFRTDVLTRDKPVRVEPVPKLYVSYGIRPTGEPGKNWYDLTITVTNLGGTEAQPMTARDVRVVTNGTREGVVILGEDAIELGDIATGETRSGHMTVRAVNQSEIVASIIPTVEVAGGAAGVRWRPFGVEVEHGGVGLEDLLAKIYEIEDLLLGDGTEANPGKLESDEDIVANAMYETIWLAHESAGLKGLLDFTDYVNQSVRNIMGTFSKVREYADMARKWTETLLDEDALWDKVKNAFAEETKKLLMGYTESLLVSGMEEDRAAIQKMVADQKLQLGKAEAELVVVTARDDVLQAFLAGLDDPTFKEALIADITAAEAGLSGESAGLYAAQAAFYAETDPDVAFLFEELAGLASQDPIGEFDSARLDSAMAAVRERFTGEADSVASRRQSLEATVEQLNKSIASLEHYLEELEAAIEERKERFQKLVADIEEVIENSDEVVEWLAGKVQGAIEEAQHTLSEKAKELIKELSGWNALVDTVEQGVDDFKEAVQDKVEEFVAAPYVDQLAQIEERIGELELEQNAKTADVAILQTEIGLLQQRAGALQAILAQAPGDPVASSQLGAIQSAVAALQSAMADRNGRLGEILVELADLRADQQEIQTQIDEQLAAIEKLKELSSEGIQLVQDIREEEKTADKVLKGVEWMVSTVSKTWDEFYASHQNEVQQHLYNLQKARMPDLGRGGITAKDVMEQGAKLTGTIELFQEAVAIAMWDIGASLPDSPAFKNLMRVAANARSMNYAQAMTYITDFWRLACQPRMVNEQELYEKFYLELLIGEEERTQARHELVESWPVDASLDDAKEAIEQDLEDAIEYLSSLGAEPPAYFPVAALYEYLEMLAQRIEDTTYTWGIPGRHMMPMVWFTFGNTDDPQERDFGTISYPLGSLYDPMHELVVAEAMGWDSVADMWRIWQLKFAVGLMGNAGAALAGSPVGQFLTLPYQMLDPLVSSYAQLIVDRNAFVRRIMTDQLGLLFVLNSGEIMATRRLALDLENSFKWLSENPIVDPPMPVVIESVQTPDIVLDPGEYFGESTGALTVRNDAGFTVQTTAEIWVSYEDQQLAVFRSAPMEISAGETEVLTFDYQMIRSLTAGLEGFDVLAYLYVVDPATLNEELLGPAYGHFYVGTADDLALLQQQDFRRLLAGVSGAAAAVHETEFTVAPDTHSVTFHFLRSEGANLRLHIRDAGTGHVGWTADATLEATIPGATITTLSDSHFLVTLLNPEAGTLSVSVADDGTAEGALYTVTALRTPLFEALLVPTADTVVVSGPGPDLTLIAPLQEASGQRAIQGVEGHVASAPTDGQGHTLPADAFAFDAGTGVIPAGDFIDLTIRVRAPAGQPDGTYTGTIVVRGIDAVSGEALEATLTVTVILDTVAPATPVLDAVTNPVTTATLRVSGQGSPNTALEFYLDEPTTPVGYMGLGEDAAFSADIALATGAHQIWVVATDAAGNRSAASNILEVISTADVTAPVSQVMTTAVPGQPQRSRVEITVADDQSAVAAVYVAYGDTLSWRLYTAPFEISRTTELTVWHYAVDAAGNAEAYQQTVLPALPATPPRPPAARGYDTLPAAFDPTPAAPVATGSDTLPVHYDPIQGSPGAAIGSQTVASAAVASSTATLVVDPPQSAAFTLWTAAVQDFATTSGIGQSRLGAWSVPWSSMFTRRAADTLKPGADEPWGANVLAGGECCLQKSL